MLGDAAAIARAIRPAGPLLPGVTRSLARALHEGTPTLRRTPALARRLGTTLAALNRVARRPSAAGSVRKLITTVTTLVPTLELLLPAQKQCNIGGTWVRNLGGVIDEGDAAGPWINLVLIEGGQQATQSSEPDSQLHLNYYPNENHSECEAGNEPFAPGQAIGNPPGNQSNTTEETRPPAGVRELAERAGLLIPVPGLAR